MHGSDSGTARLLCPSCRPRLARRRSGYCPLCGEIMADEKAPCSLCGRCLSSPPPWGAFRFYGVFEGDLREMLHRAKYGGNAVALDLLARCMLELGEELPRPDLIIPMPLHESRLRQRGFNQSKEISRLLAARWEVPLCDDLLFRTRATVPQTTLPRKERLHNLDRVFEASAEVCGKRILLTDDTSTTGTSLIRAAEALAAAGARSVDAAVIARTGRK